MGLLLRCTKPFQSRVRIRYGYLKASPGVDNRPAYPFGVGMPQLSRTPHPLLLTLPPDCFLYVSQTTSVRLAAAVITYAGIFPPLPGYYAKPSGGQKAETEQGICHCSVQKPERFTTGACSFGALLSRVPSEYGPVLT